MILSNSRPTKVGLAITAHDRPELLQQCLENLFIHYPCGADYVVVVSDNPADPRVFEIVDSFTSKGWVHHHYKSHVSLGIAAAFNTSLKLALEGSSVDYVVHCDSDAYVKRSGWCKELAAFMAVSPEVGLAAPDLPGRYMRLHRSGYDEIEYALGMLWGVPRHIYNDVRGYQGDGFFDSELHHQFEPDVCYRIRMLGYRVGIVDVGEAVDLGAGSGDSSRSSSKDSNVCRGGYEFLQKWNQKFVGPHFHYKSPMCLRWDEFPLNYLWRRMWLAQFDDVNVAAQPDPKLGERYPVLRNLQGHTFEMVSFPITPGKWLLPETRAALRNDLVFYPGVSYEDTDLALLTGKRSWQPEDSLVQRSSVC